MALTYIETKYNFAMLKLWEEDEEARIATLPDKALIAEIALIMSGRTYSWLSIAKRLANVRAVDTFYSQKWNALYRRKEEWDTMASQVGNATGNMSPNSFDESATILDYLTRSQLWDTKGFRKLLLDLKRVPVYAGLGIEGLHLVVSNMDEKRLSQLNEILKSGVARESLDTDPFNEVKEPLPPKEESFRSLLLDLYRSFMPSPVIAE